MFIMWGLSHKLQTATQKLGMKLTISSRLYELGSGSHSRCTRGHMRTEPSLQEKWTIDLGETGMLQKHLSLKVRKVTLRLQEIPVI